MDNHQKRRILAKAKDWFKKSVAEQHIKNTEKLVNPKNLTINPFLVNYIANFLTGNDSPESIAKALLYPRILGTSITTSFGSGIQKFTSDVLDAFGSTTSGIDIEFIDQVDKQRKYCQLKAGPNTINKDDVESIHGHFASVQALARTNNVAIGYGDLLVGVLYGTPEQLSGHYKRLDTEYSHPVIIGQEFWFRLTGDQHFYHELIEQIASVATEIDGSEIIQETVRKLADTEEIRRLAS